MWQSYAHIYLWVLWDPQQSQDWRTMTVHPFFLQRNVFPASVASEWNDCEQQHKEFSVGYSWAYPWVSGARGIYCQGCQFCPLGAHVLPLLVLHSCSHTISQSPFLSSFYLLHIFTKGCPHSLLRVNFLETSFILHRNQIIDCCVSPGFSKGHLRLLIFTRNSIKKRAVSCFPPW